jgi:GAF domain-containing protein
MEGLDAFLDQVAFLAADLMDVDSGCGITVLRENKAATVAASDQRTVALDEIQYGNDDGPCLHAARTGQRVHVNDVATETRWPRAIQAARQQGLCGSLSLPLNLRGDAAGALNVYVFEAFPFDEDTVEVLEEFATEASRAVSLGLRHAEVTGQSEDLHAAMRTRQVIDQAMGIIMAQNRCPADQAFAILRKASQNRNIKVRDLAAEIIHRMTGAPPDTDTHFRP